MQREFDECYQIYYCSLNVFTLLLANPLITVAVYHTTSICSRSSHRHQTNLHPKCIWRAIYSNKCLIWMFRAFHSMRLWFMRNAMCIYIKPIKYTSKNNSNYHSVADIYTHGMVLFRETPLKNEILSTDKTVLTLIHMIILEQITNIKDFNYFGFSVITSKWKSAGEMVWSALNNIHL